MHSKYIPIRALSESCNVECDSAGNCYCPTGGGGNTDLETDPDRIRDDIPDYGRGEGGYSDRQANTNPDNPDDAPPIDPDADARYWPVDNPTNPNNVAPYRGEVQDQFGNKDNRAAVVDPYGRTYPAENQDKYGNPDYGTTGGWNSDFSGQGNNGGGYSNFCCTGAT